MRLTNKKSLNDLVDEFSLHQGQITQFVRYIELLEKWSLRTNLVSKHDLDNIVSKHIYESLEIERYKLIDQNTSVFDLGTGAGFPGIPLAILNPSVKFTLLDSRRKRTLFLQEVVEECDLKNARIVCDRVETFAQSNNTRFDVVVCRAVAVLPVLWEWCHPILQKNGILVAIKGGNLDEEIRQASDKQNLVVKVLPFQNDRFVDSKKLVVASV